MPEQVEISSPSLLARALAGKFPGRFPLVTELIPHRDPMLFVDRVERCDDHMLVGTYQVPDRPFWAAGHFPEPIGAIMPGLLIVESLAQAAGCHIKLTALASVMKGLLTGADRVKFHSPVMPGDTLTLQVTRTRVMRGCHVYETSASCRAKISASANIQIVAV